MKLFDMNGPLMIALGKLADVIICNIMFILFSLPVFTIGASLTALFTCMQELITDEEKDEGLIFRDFWRAFKSNFRQATAIWLICLLFLAFLFVYYWVTRSMAGSMGRVYQITFYLLVLVFLFGFLYLFPLQARYENSVRNTMRNAWLLSVAALPWTLLSLAVIIAAVYISFFMNKSANMAAYLWAVFGFGIIAYLDSFFFRRAFRKISPETAKVKSRVSEGAVFTDEEHREQDLMVQESSYSDPNWNRREDLFPEEKPASGRKKKGRR